MAILYVLYDRYHEACEVREEAVPAGRLQIVQQLSEGVKGAHMLALHVCD